MEIFRNRILENLRLKDGSYLNDLIQKEKELQEIIKILEKDEIKDNFII